MRLTSCNAQGWDEKPSKERGGKTVPESWSWSKRKEVINKKRRRRRRRNGDKSLKVKEAKTHVRGTKNPGAAAAIIKSSHKQLTSTAHVRVSVVAAAVPPRIPPHPAVLLFSPFASPPSLLPLFHEANRSFWKRRSWVYL